MHGFFINQNAPGFPWRFGNRRPSQLAKGLAALGDLDGFCGSACSSQARLPKYVCNGEQYFRWRWGRINDTSQRQEHALLLWTSAFVIFVGHIPTSAKLNTKMSLSVIYSCVQCTALHGTLQCNAHFCPTAFFMNGFLLNILPKYNLQFCTMYSIALKIAMRRTIQFPTCLYGWLPYNRFHDLQSRVLCSALHCTM